MLELKKKDFLFSIFLIALGVYVIIESMSIYRYAAKPPFKITAIYASPAFLPILLGGVLIVLSLLLFFRSLSGEGGFAASFKNMLQSLAAWVRGLPKDQDIRNMTIGIIIMSIYSYFLIRPLHFPLASFIFLAGLMIFLRAAKIWKVALISVASVGALVLLFQVIFRISLP